MTSMPDAVGELCQRCALCCDGSLFTRVPIGVDEVVDARLQLVTNERGGRHLPQPCRALHALRCDAYEVRPLACRRFECLLVGALRDGETTAGEAHETVKRAQGLVAAARVDASRAGERDDYLTMYFGRRP